MNFGSKRGCPIRYDKGCREEEGKKIMDNVKAYSRGECKRLAPVEQQ